MDPVIEALINEIDGLRNEIKEIEARQKEFNEIEECACAEQCNDCAGLISKFNELLQDRRTRLAAAWVKYNEILGQAHREKLIAILKIKARENEPKSHDYTADSSYGRF